MGIRLTGVSLPFLGLDWEYVSRDKNTQLNMTIEPREKIKVFISSICGKKKYDNLRSKLAKALEKTNAADVYYFERWGPSTVSAGEHYTFELEDSDVCIFLIDNADGVPVGVQREIDTAQKHSIKSFYIFCDEREKTKTPVQIKLQGADHEKCCTVHKFHDFFETGLQSLVDDILFIYHHYCKGRIVTISSGEEVFSHEDLLKEIQNHQTPGIPKKAVNDAYKCKQYLLKHIDTDFECKPSKDHGNSFIDEWGERFLNVVFGLEPIEKFNLGMFMDSLKATQTEQFHDLVFKRWKAIEAYYSDDLEKCINLLQETLKKAKESLQQSWFIQDILIDLRNMQSLYESYNNHFSYPESQQELNENPSILYYPVIDRMHKLLYEQFETGIYKKKIQSSNTVELGNNIVELVGYIANSYLTALYNGSLTHILNTLDMMKDLFFYISTKYPDDWNAKKNLLKFCILSANEKEIEGITAAYPEILNLISDKEAIEIWDICRAQPIHHKCTVCQFYALGTIGYYLPEEQYKKHETWAIETITNWLNNDNAPTNTANSIIYALSGISLRISQDELANIICDFFDHRIRIQYNNLFRLIKNYIDISKMNETTAQRLINCISSLIIDDEERRLINYKPYFLITLRKQSEKLAVILDEQIKKYLPDFYHDTYNIYAIEPVEKYPSYIREYTETIRQKNEEQGKNGVYHGYAISECNRIYTIIYQSQVVLPKDDMTNLITCLSDLLLKSQQNLSEKIYAVRLLSCLLIKYPEDYQNNKLLYEELYNSREIIAIENNSVFDGNIDEIALKICMCILFSAMGKEVFSDFVELLSCIGNQPANIISFEISLIEYLNLEDNYIFPSDIDSVILQNALNWSKSGNAEIRYYACYLLLLLSRQPRNIEIINHQIIRMIDEESADIKILVLKRINKTPCLTDSIKEYIISKCSNDANYVVRNTCQQITDKLSAKEIPEE